MSIAIEKPEQMVELCAADGDRPELLADLAIRACDWAWQRKQVGASIGLRIASGEETGLAFVGETPNYVRLCVQPDGNREGQNTPHTDATKGTLVSDFEELIDSCAPVRPNVLHAAFEPGQNHPILPRMDSYGRDSTDGFVLPGKHAALLMMRLSSLALDAVVRCTDNNKQRVDVHQSSTNVRMASLPGGILAAGRHFVTLETQVVGAKGRHAMKRFTFTAQSLSDVLCIVRCDIGQFSKFRRAPVARLARRSNLFYQQIDPSFDPSSFLGDRLLHPNNGEPQPYGTSHELPPIEYIRSVINADDLKMV